MERRTFLGLLGAGALAAGTACGGRSEHPPEPQGLPVVPLGRTGLQTTLLGMGTGYQGYGGSSAIVRAGVAEALIRQAYERGLRYFDCADTYGTHPYAADALRGQPRGSYLLATKIWVMPGMDAVQTVERFLRELKTDYLDLVQLHAQSDGAWTQSYRPIMDQLASLKARQLIRAHGASIHSLAALEAALDPWVDVVHCRINPFGVSMDDPDPARVAAVLARLHAAGKGLIGMKLLGAGAYRDDPSRIDEALRFVLGLSTVDMVVVGFERPDQIDDYLTRVGRARILAG